ncbi:MAG: metallophosphoesterase [Ignavibacteriaceae bacterium]
MKIAHISDLHLNTYYRDSHLKEIRGILKYCNDSGVDHLIITGDLTDNASEINLNILKKSLTYFGYEQNNKLSVIVGNHDIFGGIQKAEEIFSFPDKCRRTDYNSKVKSFNQIFANSFSDCVFEGKSNLYPYAKFVGDALIIGINSNAEYSSISNPFASNGEVSIEQLTDVVKILNEFGNFVKHKIILIHHHFNKLQNDSGFSSAGLWQNIEKQTMKLRKKKRLYTLFQEYKIDLILHGHLHITQEYEKHGLKFLNAGGSVKCSENGKLKINLLTINMDVITSEIKKISMDNKKESKYFTIPETKNINLISQQTEVN